MKVMESKVKNSGQARLFDSPILEYFTKTTLLGSTASSLGISALCVWLGYRMGFGGSPRGAAAWFAGGLATWSLFEYLLHRFLFHIAETAFPGSRRFQYVLHGVHHEYPNDASRTLLPALPKVLITVPFFLFYWLIFGNAGAFFSSGFMMGYYFYSLVHYSIHRFRAPKILRPLWHHHHLHHHLRQDRAYGVTSTLWDRVFGTMPPDKRSEKTATAPRARAS